MKDNLQVPKEWFSHYKVMLWIRIGCWSGRFGHPNPTPHSMGYINERVGPRVSKWDPHLLQEYMYFLAVTKYPGQVLLEYIYIYYYIIHVCTYKEL